MSIKIIKTKISYLDQNLNALIFLPEANSSNTKAIGAFTHGYTSHKASILSWSTRLAEEGIANILFDQPGHYLGTFSEVNTLEEYQQHAPHLFNIARNELIKSYELEFDTELEENVKTILGGHSLGALLSLCALETGDFDDIETLSLCVGLGLPPKGVTHIFDTPFYKSTLNIRRQLVSAAISPDVIFPWIKEKKENLQISSRRIHFITGADDVVVGKDGTQLMVDSLNSNNEVSYDRPTKLPHHTPELAAPHIKKFLKDEGII
ncbi:alpha/beta hydrolase [Halobacteriovorax marinus]|uniref:alpha/beta hydrolase n=1 Tax=Halobacteriovorax marinus TaxID=97084 RepID=UPI003A920797